MAETPAHSNGNGNKTIIVAVVISVASTLIASGILGGVLLFGRMSAIEANQQATNSVIQSLHQRLAKMENDVYAPRFGRGRVTSPSQANANNQAAAIP